MVSGGDGMIVQLESLTEGGRDELLSCLSNLALL